jgi:Domain of unknown function (DUF4252)
MKKMNLALVLVAMMNGHALAASAGKIQLPDFKALEAKAIETVEVTLDSKLLGMASRFLSPDNPEEAAARTIITGLEGVYVRSYTFDEPLTLAATDIASIRSQLVAPAWSRIVGARSRKDRTHVEVYIRIDGEKATGLTVLAIEPKEFTVVNIVGAIDLEKLHRLEGQLGVPKLEIDTSNSPGRKPEKR